MNAAITKFEALASRLADNMAGGFVCGENLTSADITLGHVLFRYFDIEIDRRPDARIVEYYRRLCDRPAFRDHVMIDYSELAVPGA